MRNSPAQERCCDGVWLAELSCVRDPALLELALAESLGLTDHTTRPPRTVLAEHLAERRLLLVLDGFEQPVDETAALVRELLRRSPGLRVLAAGRRPLPLDGERAFPLAPPAPEEALELLAERAAGADPGFAVTGANRAALVELCTRLDGIPLALELAAGRLRALSPEQVLVRLEDRFALLTGGARGALPRHRTLRTAIGWSHELCTAQERLLWARMSVFAGHFDLDAAEYVCAGPDLPVESVLDVLGELLAQSLLAREETDAWAGCGRLTEGRYWLERTLEPGPAGSDHVGSRLKALWVLGYVAALQGDAVASMSAQYECRDGAERTGNAVAQAYAAHRLGCLALVCDDMARAGELLGSALERHRGAGEGHPAEAAVLQGAAEPLGDGVGLQLFGSGYFNAPRLRCRERAGELLGAERYEACARHGRSLSPDELVERALRGPDPVRAAPEPLPRPRSGEGAGRAGHPENRKPVGSPRGEPTG